jgi:hypothetical protein
MAINDKPYSLDNIYDMIGESQNWKENDAITVKIKRMELNKFLKERSIFLMKRKSSLNATDATKKDFKRSLGKKVNKIRQEIPI